jgi:hypothetical protein
MRMGKWFGKKMITKQHQTKILPLRFIANICGGFANNHLFKAMCLDEDEDYGWRYRYHSKMWLILNKPYKLWGTHYIMDN